MCILTFQSLLWNLYLTSASCSIWESCHCLVELEQGPVKKLAVKVEVLFDKVLVSPFSFFISFACSSSKLCDGVHIIKCHHLLFSHESACSVCMSSLSLHMDSGHVVGMFIFKNPLVCIISFIFLFVQVGFNNHRCSARKQSKGCIFLLFYLFITEAFARFQYTHTSGFVQFLFCLNICQTGIVCP